MSQKNIQDDDATPLALENFELSDVIDAPAIQEMMNDYYALTGIGIGIIDLKGNVLVGTGWQDICVKFHRAVPESYKLCYECDTALSSGVTPGAFKTYRCKNNMWDMATPIMLGDTHIGNIFLGQFLYDDEVADYELFRAQAKRFGYDETAYIAALDSVSRFSRQTVQTAMSYYSKLAQLISKSNYNNIVLAQTLTKRKQAEATLRDSEEKYRLLVNNLSSGVVVHAPDSSVIFSNPMASTLLGLTMDQMRGKEAMDPAWCFLQENNPLFPAHRSGHRLFQRPSPGKQFPWRQPKP